MTGKPGFRINFEIVRPERGIVERLKSFSTANISDGMLRFRAMDYRIKPLNRDYKIMAPAITVKVRPGDNLMLHKAIDVAQVGDILVVDTSGCYTNAVFGELMCLSASAKKLGGIVVDGAVRDVPELIKIGFPVFTRALVPTACDKDGPGEINYPISCGGVTVHPGDLISGDADGVIVVPREDLTAIPANIENKMEYERKRVKAIKDGIIISPDIDKILKEKGVI